MIREEVWKAALAGLLHDIGKFAQRAGVEVRGEWSDPQTQAEFGYQHALHTWHFARRYLPEPLRAEIADLAAHHHRPHGRGLVVQVADHLAAGERRKEEGDDSDRSIHPRQMHPVFIGIRADGQEHPLQGKGQFYFPLAELALQEEVIFPQTAPLPEAQVWKRYEQLWDAFCHGASQLKAAAEQSLDLPAYLESLLSLMQRYTWCIPAAYFKAVPDISLYDHSRMTAALTACLAEFDEATLQRLAENPEASDQEVALLIGGDVSGVQDFIYTISSKGAAKMLRGRSFYLQLLTEAVVRLILRRLGLPYTSVVYAGGGHFYLLAPLSAAEKLPDIQAEVGRLLLQEHHLQLYLVLDGVRIPASGFQGGRLSEYWQRMTQRLTIAKNRRYGELQDELFASLFEVPEYGGNPDQTCSVCGDEQRGAQEWDEWEAQSKICPLCRSFAETIGKELPAARFIAFQFGQVSPAQARAKTALEILEHFGMRVQFLKDSQQKVDAHPDRHCVIWALDDPPAEKWPAAPANAVRWVRYTTQAVPPYTFDQLQEKSESGFHRLGVLRMDVDNLGSIFKDGLAKAFSLSRLATLSFQISLFFEGWLKRIVEDAQWQGLVYTVYSGGDDLFLLAPWEKVPLLANRIQADFARYTGHPGLHISGGMAFIDGKYPIYQAAADAAEAEDLAKKGGKNAFAFLGRAWQWSDFQILVERKDALKDLVSQESPDQKAGPKSLLQTIRSLALMEEEAVELDGRPLWGRWMWLGAYQFHRLEERARNHPELKHRLADLRQQLEPFRNLQSWGAAARWAMLETRVERKRV